ncbi:hypothetical protein HN592_05185 [Candidatus Woesearchaeota archaeon]|jgi:His-Xaa-Ser system protein HxsD|nr:hypothetical protein [Candidatus Woesearchaeota archaeon]MBT4367779.1 hypothetical protein [Candidatus Woesearchaeota archaeon]MBT4712267.1 hypothetical protein [Candidatus Woesearchaeota archaeon]MBT6638815.1 hypothetical protein [Candidatus Woesearchaeota archaeon]MBT7134459.1 hypothetical protein [Candidatus Woesearchaeota archaeon]
MQNIKIKNGIVKIKVNTSIYPLETIYSALYVFLDRAYVLLDGNPKKNVIVNLKPKCDEDLNIIGQEFNNELINYASYKEISERNKEVKKILLSRALLTNNPQSVQKQLLEEDEEVKIPWEDDQ